FSLASLVIRTDLMPNAAFFARLMAARHGRKFYTKMKTPELSTSSLIWLTRKLFMRTCGLRAALHGPQGILIAALEAACTHQPTAVETSPQSKVLPEAMTTTRFGSIRRIHRSSH